MGHADGRRGGEAHGLQHRRPGVDELGAVGARDGAVAAGDGENVRLDLGLDLRVGGEEDEPPVRVLRGVEDASSNPGISLVYFWP